MYTLVLYQPATLPSYSTPLSAVVPSDLPPSFPPRNHLNCLSPYMVCVGANTQGQAYFHTWPTILIKEHLQNFVSLKSSVCAKVDGWKALLGIGIAYCVARSWPTTLLEPVALRAGERRAWA